MGKCGRPSRCLRVGAEVADSSTMDCMYCGVSVNPDGRDTYTQVVGFTHPRSGGGTNTIALKAATGKFACSPCVNGLKQNISPDQGSLLDL